MVNQRALSQYQQVNIAAAVDSASPHRLVQMLMEGVLRRVAEARGAIARGDIAAKGTAIGKAIDIVAGLRGSLNKEVDSNLPDQLDAIYEYMQSCLLRANVENSDALLEEVGGLMRTVKEGWDGIAQTGTTASDTASR